MTQEQRENLIQEVEKLHKRNELSQNVQEYYFEPGMMEYLEQSEGSFDESAGIVYLRFEARGTRYDGRTEIIEKVKVGDEIRVVRDETNPYNHNNFFLLTKKGKDIGNVPAEICNVIAPLYDQRELIFENACVSFVEPISKRSRYAKQAVLFVEVAAKVTTKNLV